MQLASDLSGITLGQFRLIDLSVQVEWRWFTDAAVCCGGMLP